MNVNLTTREIEGLLHALQCQRNHVGRFGPTYGSVTEALTKNAALQEKLRRLIEEPI